MFVNFRYFRTLSSKLFQLTMLSLAFAFLVNGASVFAQETRGSIAGAVRDSSGAVVPGAAIAVTNVGTNTSTEATSNESGVFEVPYLVPGTYSVSATATGFKKFVQQGIIINVGTRSNIDVVMEVGAVTEEVVVTSDASLLDTTSGSGAAVLTNEQIRNIPVFGNSALLTVRSAPGIQWTGAPNYVSLHSNVGASQISAAGGVGGTEFVLDGIPNTGPGRRAGYLPYTDSVEEVRISTSDFDASEGHTSGATINMVTKSGTNDFHGSFNYLHWQQRLNGTQTFTKAAYFDRINKAVASGDTALAERLRNEPRQSSGRSNTYSGTIGGPIYLPRFGEGGPSFFSGKDKLFFFFAYNGYKEAKSEEPNAVNRTVPSLAHRQGDFSDLLALGSQYQIYDPRTARCEDGRTRTVNGQVTCNSGVRVIRDPFPGNRNIPVLNPLYDAYARFYPLPNGNPAATRDGRNNYLASATPFNWDYNSYQNRIDWNITANQKLFGKWSYNNFFEDRGDWTYETARGLQSNGLVRRNRSVGLDYVLTINPTTLLNLSVGYNRFIEGNAQNATQASFSPTSVGLPAYLTNRPATFTKLPEVNFSAYSSLTGGPNPGYTRYSVATTRGELSKIFTGHSVRLGYDLRQNYRASDNPGDVFGSFSFSNAFVRQRDNTNNAQNIGLEWAAFMLGVPSGVGASTNDSLYLTNPFGGVFIQDDWRVSSKLTLNLGFRYELEGGFRERFNRGIGQFDPNAELPIATAAEAAYAAIYAANPNIGTVAPSEFQVRGGSLYLGENGAPRTVNNAKPAYMPRLGFAYQMNGKTVLRGGYGLFYDTTNVLNNGLDQSGFNRGTNPIISDNGGLTFQNTNLTSTECRANPGACRTVFIDPFPLRNGTRFDTPFGNDLGLLSRTGRGFGYINRDWERARQQRWRIGVQREITNNIVFEMAYMGSYTDNMSTVGDNPGDNPTNRRIDVLPEQYWSRVPYRNVAVSDYLTANVPNPFNIGNFEFLRTQNPLAFQDFSSNGFFTSGNIQRQQLLRQFPQQNGLFITRVPDVTLKYHHMEASLTQRFSKGVSYMASYMWGSSQVRDFLQNEFDEKPVYRQNLNYRPHSFKSNFVYELPFGKGKRFLSEGGFLSKLAGGWQFSGAYFLQSGRTYDFPNLFFYGDTKDIKLSDDERTTENWFNWRLFPRATRDYSERDPSAYRARIRQIVPAEIIQAMGRICGGDARVQCTYDNVVPGDFQPANFQARVFPSRFNHLRGDIMSQVDVNVVRNINITENTRMEFRTDFINLLNSVQWDNPNSNDPGSENFGRVTNQYNTPRWIQFQLRLTF